MSRRFEMFGCHNVIVAKISGAASAVAVTFGRRANEIIASDSYSRMVTALSQWIQLDGKIPVFLIIFRDIQ